MNDEHRSVLIGMLILIVFVMISSSLYARAEGIAYFDSFFFVVMMITTVGSQSFWPATAAGQVISMVTVVFGFGIAFYVLTLIAKIILVDDIESLLRRIRRKKDR